MKTLQTSEGKQIEVADLVADAVARWNAPVMYCVNRNASEMKPIISELKSGEETVVLRGANGRFFLEYYSTKTFYPSVFRVVYVEAKTIEITDEEFERWMRERESK